MSYVKNFSGSIPYSKTVSYGKSETGGTITVNGSVPVSIQLYVDTSPFDASVSDCNAGISVLAGSVAALNQAQISQIQKNAKNISDHVTNGFFSMIKSEISQNMATLFSKINSFVGLITEKTNQLTNHQKVMEDDYNRIKKRYVGVFQNLDDECYRRIVELDRNAFDLANKIQKEQISQLQSKQVSSLLLGLNEDEILKLQVSTASLNGKTQNAICTLSQRINQEKVYSTRLEAVMQNKNPEAREVECVPVVFMEADSLEYNGADSFCYGPNLSQEASDAVKQYFVQSDINWHSYEQNHSLALERAFNAQAEKSLLESEQQGNRNARRIYETIMALRQQETLTN